ncbi:hypothetical protein Ahy_A04g020248 [Arachis hypogaea]|uniref:Uncharacterized protein n=1 Tax=Arachis hypogaea TaxID=3818 RepID=A0A445DHB4_ARAHY|nr:hypothetical protein Ahy_A04g020248 [Arachis hypogaea]
MTPRVKGKGVRCHRGSRTTAAATISTTSTSSGTSVVPDFQSGPLSQQPYLMIHRSSSTKLAYSRMYGSPSSTPPPISISPPPRNFNLLVNSETLGSSSTSPPSKTASVPNSVTKERLFFMKLSVGYLSFLVLRRLQESSKIDMINRTKSLEKSLFRQRSFGLRSGSHLFIDDDDDDEFFWRAFKYKTSKRFSQMMSDIHEGVDTTHEWLISAYKKVLERKKARENRASLLGGFVHCGGSIPLSATIERMKKQLGHTPTHEKIFKETNTLKSDMSKWVDKRSQDAHVRYSINVKLMYMLPLEYLCTHIHTQHVEAQAQGMELPPIDEDLIWEEVCGGKKKNRIYRKVAFFSSSTKSRTTSANSVSGRVRASSSSSAVPLLPPPPPPSISSDEDYDDEDEDSTEDYS